MRALAAQVEGIGVLGPGFADWRAAAAVLSGERPVTAESTVVPSLDVLPAAERRRAALIVRLAIAAGLQATTASGREPARLASVFASSGADGPNCHEMCVALASNDRQVSPTRFHNSVHNAPAGYWSIATAAQTPSIALSAHDASFAAGLLEALTQLAADARPVLLVAYDAPYPHPLDAARPIAAAFAVALVLAPAVQPSANMRFSVTTSQAPATRMANPQLESLRCAIPAARSLPVLQLLARREQGKVSLAGLGGQSLNIEVWP